MITDIAIIGSSISANLMAAYLKKKLPTMEVSVVMGDKKDLPVVGESLTEFSTYLLHSIGLSSYLEEDHYHKYGLTFYFKERLSDPSDRTYAVHEAPAVPPMPSNQINRFTLDQELARRNQEAGVKFIPGKVKDLNLSSEDLHQLVIRDNAGEQSTLQARWVIDASGRSRVIAKHLGLQRKAPLQRSAFWFRVRDFDSSLLSKIRAVKPEQWAYNSYFATHHFFGKGNWVWCIPMRTDSFNNLISIGLVWRPDLYPQEVRSVEGFLENVSKEHPVVADLVRSGMVVDSHLYRNYMYECSQVYSENRWFIVGDAGDAVDPLYSTGLVMTSIQVTQITAAIERECQGQCSSQYIRDMEAGYKAVRNALQHEIGGLYEVMHDTYQSHWRVHLASALYFFSMLPAWLSGYMTDEVGVKWIKCSVDDGFDKIRSLVGLLPDGSARLGLLSSQSITNKYFESVNWELWKGDETKLPRYLSKLCFLLAKYRLTLLRDAGWRDWRMHCKIILEDVATGILMGTVLRRTTFRKSRLVLKRVAKLTPNVTSSAEVMPERKTANL